MLENNKCQVNYGIVGIRLKSRLAAFRAAMRGFNPNVVVRLLTLGADVDAAVIATVACRRITRVENTVGGHASRPPD